MSKWMFIVALTATAILTGCKRTDRTESDINRIAVSLARVETQRMSTPVFGSGLVSSETEARLSFKTGGIIQKIFVEEGQKIVKGQLLASLNLTEINAQVNQATESFQKSERDLQRVRRLYDDSVATLEQMQNATTAFMVAKQALAIAQYNQNFSRIRATTDGVVIRKLMNEGELVSPGMPVLFINANGKGDWVLKIGLADRDWVRLAKGNKATITVDAYSQKTFAARVSKLSEGADPATGAYQVELHTQPEGYRLATGMFAKATISPATTKEYRLIPVESMVEGNGSSAFVFVPQGNHVKKIPITIEAIRSDNVLVTQGLDGVDNVIKDGAGYLAANSNINLVQRQ